MNLPLLLRDSGGLDDGDEFSPLILSSAWLG